MAIFKFFHTPKPRQYTYKPQYYDQQKEELQERLRKIKDSEDLNDPEAAKIRISRSFRQKFRQDKKLRKKQARKSNIRLVMTIVILFLLSYLLLIKYFPNIEKLLS